MELNCRRVNLFIGEPNTGKSNILEALGMLSWCGWSSGANLRSFARFQLTQNLFYDNLTDDPIRIECQGKPSTVLEVKYEKEHFQFWLGGAQMATLDYRGQGGVSRRWTEGLPIKLYRCQALEKYESAEPGVLLPPNGPNLFSVVFGSKIMRDWLIELFRPYGLEVVLE